MRSLLSGLVQYFKGSGLPSAFFALASLAAPAAWAETTVATALESISTEQLRQHVEVLANDMLEGREAGSRGGRAAAGYLADQFTRLKLRPAGDSGGYFQSFGHQCRNILATIEGSDPKLRDEVIVVGAHYDHVGYGNRSNSYGPWGYIHNGADDNASGDAGLLEVAEALAMLEPAPRRTVLFALWDAEEKGLLGSKHWLANPTLASGRIVLAVNMDMIGRLRDNRLEIAGSRTAPGLRGLVSEFNQESGPSLDFPWELTENSDHYSFFVKRIPTLLVHTGLHGDYHRPSDDVERLNFDGMRTVARLSFNMVAGAANAERLPAFRDQARYENDTTKAGLFQPLPTLPSRLGLSWRDDHQDGQPGLLVTQLTPGAAAERGGLKVGDRLLKFGGHELHAGTDLRTHVLAAHNPVPVVVRRAGSETPVELSLTLSGDPVRLGIGWQVDAGEPGTVVLLRVTPGSLADKAGLQVHDRVEQVSGRTFAGSDEFQRLVHAPVETLELLVERAGRKRLVSIPVRE